MSSPINKPESKGNCFSVSAKVYNVFEKVPENTKWSHNQPRNC